MAYITPNSTVRFHQNIPLDNTYDHTLYFSSLSEQETYFSYRNQSDPTQSRVKYQIDNYTYQRHTRDSIRVGLPIENIVNCSYMSFKNTSFENKWFYAFITDMEYVNNNTTIVYYEIDVMQTYVINDVTFEQCYIERQHTETDNIGENTQPEPIGACEYVYSNAVGYGVDASYIQNGRDVRYDTMSIVVACTFDGEPSQSPYVDYTEIALQNYEYYRSTLNGSSWSHSGLGVSDGGYAINNLYGYTNIKIEFGNIDPNDTVGIAFLKSLSNINHSGGTVDYCANTQFIPLQSNTETVLAIPNDCQYIFVQNTYNNNTYADTYTGLGRTTNWDFGVGMYGGLYGGCYSGVRLKVFPATILGAQECTQFLESASTVPNLIDGIISIFMIPTAFTKSIGTADAARFGSVIKKYNDWTINGTPPKNNKIYTAPFTLLHVITSDGKCADFNFELFSELNYVSFRNIGIAMPVSEIELIPEAYRGLSFNRNEKFTIENYPQCSFVTDSYKAWLALNSSKMNLESGLAIAGGVLSVLGTANSVSTSNSLATTRKQKIRAESAGKSAGISIAGSAIDAIGTISSNLIERKLASTMPPHANGQNTNILSVSESEFGYHYYYCRPKDEYAKIIDEFFTRFGYAINRNTIPNLCARTRFTYIKTVDCTIKANIPNEYSQAIVSIMNNGITFWNDKNNVGDYTLANNIITSP